MAKVDLNTATLEELQTIVGVDGECARYITRSRPFQTWRDVQAVAGVNLALMLKLLDAASINLMTADVLNEGGASGGLEPRIRTAQPVTRKTP
ncbi:MAG TPA: helix-hairpin-helix domain-containing protein [Polyangiaceae bacterium]|nr:helix-hairpin-helix domain-containing protein [Polyangiaceae bacterium]